MQPQGWTEVPNYLLIDAGNTRVKWVTSQDGKLSASRNTLYPQDFSSDEMADLLTSLKSVDQIFMACVANEMHEQWLTEGFQDSLSAPLNAVSVQSPAFGITVCYEDAGRLGADRWAAMIAARHLVAGAVCVIDTGTATTFDLVDADGQHLGGLIVPGLELMSSSLLYGTARIYGDANCVEKGLLACDTLSAVIGGGLQATVGFIERLLREVPKITGTVPTFFLCGGNAKDLLPLLPNNIRHEPDLVLKGLNVIATDRL